MDHKTFQESEIDALYGELDAAASAAMAEHAATCESCGARFDRAKDTRGLVLSAAIEEVPTDFESRIMAAVDAGMASRGAGRLSSSRDVGLASKLADVIPIGAARPSMDGAHLDSMGRVPSANAPHGAAPPRVAKAEPSAKIFGFMSRPAFAAAAGFVLVLGGAAFVMSRSAKKMSAMSVADESPAASSLTAVPMSEDEQAKNAATPPAALAAAPMATTAASAAFGERSGAALGASPEPAATAAPMAVAANDPAPAKMALAKAAKPSAGPGNASDDRAFAAAKALFNAGRYAEALPRFEALSGTSSDADLYAARCIARTQGCGAAAPRYDAVAQANNGTLAGNRATLEGARCYQVNGELAEARKRYAVAKDQDGVSTEAAQALDALDHKGAGAGGGSGAGGAAHAAPRSLPAPAPPAPPALK